MPRPSLLRWFGVATPTASSEADDVSGLVVQTPWIRGDSRREASKAAVLHERAGELIDLAKCSAGQNNR
jgi:hypothetical protein